MQHKHISWMILAATLIVSLPSWAKAEVTPAADIVDTGTRAAVNPTSMAAPPVQRVSPVRELLTQLNFDHGIRVRKACPNPDTDTKCGHAPLEPFKNPLFPNNSADESVWEGVQWGSRQSLPSKPVYHPENGGFYIWADETKSFSLFKDGRAEMAVNGENDLQGKYKDFSINQKWPHWGIGQNIHRADSQSSTIAKMGHLNFQLDVRLTYNKRIKKEGFRSDRSIIFVMSVTVQNLRQGSPGYGQYIWFQVPIFHDEVQFPTGSVMFDDHTQMAIVSTDYKEYSTKNLHDGEWVNLRRDILPFMKDGIKQAHARGYLKSANEDDYQLGGMHLMFENGGLNISTIQFKNLSFKEGEAAAIGTASTSGIATEGYHRIAGNPAIFYSNGTDKYCVFPNPEIYFKWSGRKDFDVPTTPAYPAKMKNEGACKDPSTYGAGGLASVAASARAPAGYFRVNNGIGIHYSNGADAYCVFTNPQTFFKWRGREGFDNVDNRSLLPVGMRFDGECK